MDRRDYTNQSGAFVPTETKALRNIETEEKALATGRKIYGVFVRVCCLVGFTLNKVEIERNGFKFTEEDFKCK